jgi:Calcineurin-like phosphoesterase
VILLRAAFTGRRKPHRSVRQINRFRLEYRTFCSFGSRVEFFGKADPHSQASSKSHENLLFAGVSRHIQNFLGRPVSHERETNRYRTLFLSDIHLGTRGCQANLLLDFLKHNEAETVFLIGDIIDGWRLKSGWYWPQTHNDVVQKLLRQVRKGVKMVYVPGNHDEFARDFTGIFFGGSKSSITPSIRPPTASVF